MERKNNQEGKVLLGYKSHPLQPFSLHFLRSLHAILSSLSPLFHVCVRRLSQYYPLLNCFTFLSHLVPHPHCFCFFRFWYFGY
ncbi:hypothetical protein NC652_004817 [Populus alba x Populus x berolinensis]|nr:hypothetical protein NC652_004817 [Populus alba x Populus x berolinensis]